MTENEAPTQNAEDEPLPVDVLVHLPESMAFLHLARMVHAGKLAPEEAVERYRAVKETLARRGLVQGRSAAASAGPP